jgi:uncharacterized protein
MVDRSVGSTRSIWIDLDNSPHVPFFAPVIKELEKRGHSVVVTGRDAYQVRELAELHDLTYRCVGRHYGKKKILKLLGTCFRAMQLLAVVKSERPDLALSHGSRSQVLTAGLLRTRSLVINDYEFSRGTILFHPSYVMAPDVIPSDAFKHMSRNVLTYRGIKEDVYAAGFSPDPSILERLRIKASDVVVAVRPPAVEAHYHRQDSDTLFDATMNFLRGAKGLKIVLLPRNDRQAAQLRTTCRDLLDSGDMVIPDRAEAGLNLVWYSDLVISGGGTMNREAAALGVPAYSIFRGAIGAVDRHLAEQGRLILLENAGDLQSRVRLQQRVKMHPTASGARQALSDIVEHIERIVSGHAPRS